MFTVETFEVSRFGVAPFMILIMFFAARSEGKRRSKLMRLSDDQFPSVDPTQFFMWHAKAINATKIVRWGIRLPLWVTIAGFIAVYESKILLSVGKLILAAWLISWGIWFCMIFVSVVVNRNVSKAAEAIGIVAPK